MIKRNIEIANMKKRKSENDKKEYRNSEEEKKKKRIRKKRKRNMLYVRAPLPAAPGTPPGQPRAADAVYIYIYRMREI